MESIELMQYISWRNGVTTQDAENLLDLFIAEITAKLCNGKNVFLPGLGYLEIKNIPGRKTVFFKSLPLEMLEKETPLPVHEIISELMLQGKIIKLPAIGIFYPEMDEKGTCRRVCFTLSSALRSALNTPSLGNENIFSAPAKKESESFIETHAVSNNESKKEKSFVKKEIVPTPEVTKPRFEIGRKFKLLLSFIALLFMLIFLYPLINSNPDAQLLESSSTQGYNNRTGSLLEFANKHYGHPAYWVYIYEYNKEKLSSPFNKVRESEIHFPDLKTDYNVDLSDSLEIVRANMLAEEVLKKNK